MNTYGVILAGGGGTRFWPLSRKDLPKQFLNLTGEDLMLNETIDRLSAVVGKENVFVVTGESQAELVTELSDGRMPKDHILKEPAARNTAACICYAALTLQQRYGEGVMCISPSDHYIKDKPKYISVLQKAVLVAAESDRLVTIGIRPTFAATGYGYLHVKDRSGEVLEVTEFVEKPDTQTAKSYLEQGDYLWNSGMFVWRTEEILQSFQKLLPDIYGPLSTMTEANKNTVYPDLPKISIDYGIMERSKNVVALPGDFGWSDVGSWDALQALYRADDNGNVLYGDQIHIDTHNCIAYAKTKLIAALGVEDLIIVEADDAILVCHRDKAQEVGKVVEQLKSKGKTEYL